MTAEVAQQALYCPTCERTFTTGERCPNDNTRFVRLTGSRDTLLGRDLDGRYTIVEKLGQGGMGAVYRGTQHSVGRDVAIKVVTPRLMSDDIVIKRFLREAKLASRLSHPNAVSVLDFGQTDHQLFYLVMELVVGRTLDEVLASDGVMSPERVVRIGAQICDALEGAHTLNIIHRDLKPANIMLLSTGRDLVKVLDFGLARSLTKEAGMTTMTSEGMVLGTPAFMPPEAIGASSNLDGRSDLYSLGCVLYNAASGHPPFGGTTLHELVAKHLTEPPPPLVDLPVGLWTVLERLLAKTPDLRYPTARSARDALDACLVESPDALVPTVVAVEPRPAVSGRPAVAPPSVAAPPAALMQTIDASTERDFGTPSPPAPRKRWPLVVAGAAVVALAAAGAFALFGGGKHHDSKRAPKPHESGASSSVTATGSAARTGSAATGSAATQSAPAGSAATGSAATGSAATGSARTGSAGSSGTSPPTGGAPTVPRQPVAPAHDKPVRDRPVSDKPAAPDKPLAPITGNPGID